MNEVWNVVGRECRTNPENVRNAVQDLMLIAMASEDSTAQEHWQKLCKNGRMPTPEEFLRYICMLVMEQAS